MMSGSTNIKLKLGLFNVENLFLLFNQEVPTNFAKLNEAQWQKISGPVYQNKALPKCQRIAQIIKDNSPDIMMLCEVGGPESLKNFNHLFLNSQYQVALLEGNSDRSIDVGFLVKKDSPFFFDIASNKKRPINTKEPAVYFSRDCAELRLFTNSRENPFFIVLLTHLKSRLDPERIDPGGFEKRGAELKAALMIYKELREQFQHTPIVLSGDMNGFAGRPQTDPEFLPLYTETDLEDILEIANLNTEKRSTFYQLRNGKKSEGKQIDYCFLSENLKPKLIKSSATVYRYVDEFGFEVDAPRTVDDKSQLPSDHYPLFFTLENIDLW